MAALKSSIGPRLRACWPTLGQQLPAADHPRDYYHAQRPSYNGISHCEQVARTLFDANAEADTNIRAFGNILRLASDMDNEAIVYQLLAKTTDLNISGGYFIGALLAALKDNHPRILALVSQPIDLNYSSPEHGPALHDATAHGPLDTV